MKCIECYYIIHTALFTTVSRKKLPLMTTTKLFGRLSNSINIEEEEESNSYDVATTTADTDEGRRRFLLSTSSASLLLLSNIDYALAAPSAPAVDEIISPTADTFIDVRATAAKTAPSSSTSTLATSSSRLANNNIICSADSAEIARISIFERVAPSVVYIDTFSEKCQ